MEQVAAAGRDDRSGLWAVRMSEPLTAAIGWSAKADPARAGKEAAETAASRLAAPARLAFLFASSRFNQPVLLKAVRDALGDTPLIGESASVDIVPEGPTMHSCAVLLLGSKTLACGTGIGRDLDRSPREAGQRAAHMALQRFHGSPRVGFLLFADGLVATHADATRGIQEVLGTSALIIGGIAGDDDHDAAVPCQYFDGQVATRAAVGVLLGGGIKLGVGMEHGFAPVSRPHRITRATANRLYELDRRPALAVYEDYVGAELIARIRRGSATRQRIAYPFGMQREGSGPWLLRNVHACYEDGSLACTGELAEGAWMQLMISSRELALEAALTAARAAIRPLNQVACALVFDSGARRTLLGAEGSAREIAGIRDILGASTPFAGCYTYGEQAPSEHSASRERTAIQTGSILVVALGS